MHTKVYVLHFNSQGIIQKRIKKFFSARVHLVVYKDGHYLVRQTYLLFPRPNKNKSQAMVLGFHNPKSRCCQAMASFSPSFGFRASLFGGISR